MKKTLGFFLYALLFAYNLYTMNPSSSAQELASYERDKESTCVAGSPVSIATIMLDHFTPIMPSLRKPQDCPISPLSPISPANDCPISPLSAKDCPISPLSSDRDCLISPLSPPSTPSPTKSMLFKGQSLLTRQLTGTGNFTPELSQRKTYSSQH